MSLFEIISLLLCLAAVFSYINYKYIKLPTTIGIMLLSLLFSLALLLFGEFGFSLDEQATELVKSIDFNEALLHGMLSFLLFAGALHVNLNDLREQKWVIGTLATAGVISSTFIIGTVMYYILGWLGIPVAYIYCLVFGALISPTDPIAVMGILKLVGAPKTLETKIAGESLFNDGVGVVVFLVLLGIATGGDEMSASHVVELFAVEALGGVFFGLGLGYLGFFMLKGVDNYQVEALITLALVSGGYAFAESIHISAPIAIVVAGLFIGNQGRTLAMSDNTRERLDDFWELIDEILNAILFLLIGVELLILTFTNQFMLAGLLAIPVVLLARFICVGIPIKIMSKFRTFSPYATTILTWGGLRGGISVALALSIPDGPAREPLLVITYFIVVFSILVQGLTIKKVLAFSQK
ncbi:MAG: sodium:proton antiporter [Gammaproteobacteria bacterium]|nr:sodium:proton antiporter [Gammaproteobacteria bacterium]